MSTEEVVETGKPPFELCIRVGNKMVTKGFWGGAAVAQWFETQKQAPIPETPEWLQEEPKGVQGKVRKEKKKTTPPKKTKKCTTPKAK